MSHLHSIFLTGGEPARTLPWAIERNIESFVHHHPDFEHHLWDDVSGRDFIETNFDEDVLNAWDELVPLAYRSDLLRYCLLHELGGIYADVATHFFAPLTERTDDPRAMFFRDMFNQTPWMVSNSILHAPAGLDLFCNCIRRIVRHVSEGYYGTNSLCPTGPDMLGQEIARWGRAEDWSLGDSVGIIRGSGGTSVGRNFIDADNRLVAVIAKAGPGLSSLGAKQQNNYNTFYQRRKIYRRELDAPDVWTLEDYLKNGNLNGQPGDAPGSVRLEAGCALYGPYVALDEGQYRVRMEFGSTPPRGAVIDVIAGYRELKEAVRFSDDESELSLDLTLGEPQDGVEIRLFLDEAQELEFKQLELVRENVQKT